MELPRRNNFSTRENKESPDPKFKSAKKLFPQELNRKSFAFLPKERAKPIEKKMYNVPSKEMILFNDKKSHVIEFRKVRSPSANYCSTVFNTQSSNCVTETYQNEKRGKKPALHSASRSKIGVILHYKDAPEYKQEPVRNR